MRESNTSSMILSFLIGLSIIASSAILGACIKSGLNALSQMSESRLLSVKGVAEREIHSDLAFWSIPIQVSGDNLDASLKEAQNNIQSIKDFLIKFEIPEQDIELGAMRFEDRKAERYYDAQNLARRYFINQEVLVKSKEVKNIEMASKNINTLITGGINISYSAPRFLFTKLNDIKPNMLSLAVSAAKEAANELIANSDDVIDRAKNIKQGLFDIDSRSQLGNPEHSIEKIVRVVVHVDYTIKNGAVK